jgi:ABC-type nitrate/sulfonate/bicarbonate transport system substrate-binding protein
MLLNEARGMIIKMIKNKSSRILNNCHFIYTTVIALVLGIIAAAFILSCSKMTFPEQTEKQHAGQDETSMQETISSELQQVTVMLDWVPNTNHTGIYIAKDKGYYEKAGMSVEIIQPSEGGSADLIAAGRGQFGISYQEQVTYARTAENPLPVIAIAAILQHNTSGFASPADKNIKSPADFEGKKYGGWGSPMEEAILKGLMEKYGSNFDTLEIVNIGAADFFTSVTKDVDFTWIYYGWDGVAAEVNNFEINFMLLQDLDSRLDFYTPVIITSEKTASQNPGLVTDFLDATEQGYRFAKENPIVAADILVSNVPELDIEIVKASQQYLADRYLTEGNAWGFMDENIWKTFGDWMYENNLLKEQLDWPKAFTNQYLP